MTKNSYSIGNRDFVVEYNFDLFLCDNDNLKELTSTL